jgi:hypothetical protein
MKYMDRLAAWQEMLCNIMKEQIVAKISVFGIGYVGVVSAWASPMTATR